MRPTAPWIAACVICLGGCASNAVPQGNGDEAFVQPEFAQRDTPDLVTVTREDLFRLPPELDAKLREAKLEHVTTQQKLKHLMALIFGADLRGFGYAAGHSTVAAQTWQNKRGDCLSLTVLTYAVARSLHMQAQMQEVRVPVFFDRRGQLDVVNQHVNVLFRKAHRNLEESEARDVVIDFEPDFAYRRAGRALTEDGILARYYNNIATEHLVAGRRQLAHAHFRAAIRTDPSYGASYGNLAVLYREAGRVREAEQLLLQAARLSETPDVALYELVQLVQAQGRTADAQRYAEILHAARERDPYYWTGLGVQRLDAGEVKGAIAALERARDMSRGFDEVHRYLALAYWRAGDIAKARQELAALAASGDEVGLAKFKGKLRGLPSGSEEREKAPS
jgi:tetratricopeptide (TPR) repeat protein